MDQVSETWLSPPHSDPMEQLNWIKFKMVADSQLIWARPLCWSFNMCSRLKSNLFSSKEFTRLACVTSHQILMYRKNKFHQIWWYLMLFLRLICGCCCCCRAIYISTALQSTCSSTSCSAHGLIWLIWENGLRPACDRISLLTCGPFAFSTYSLSPFLELTTMTMLMIISVV